MDEHQTYILKDTVSLGKHDLGTLVNVVKKTVNRQCKVLEENTPILVNKEFQTSQQEEYFSSVDEVKS